ncbi:hypothetical protein EDD11_010576 [Mortierella claussenii]|nr:hypothetical protein EDD11_010576 [Mortierella claussenii]
MTRHPLPAYVGDSIHGQSQAALLKLHQQSLEKTINATLTIVENDTDITKQQQQQRTHNKKKKKYYPWIQRDSQNQRNKIGLEGSRHKFVHHPFAVLYQVDLAFPGYDRDAPTFHWKYDAMIESLISNNPPSSRRSKPISSAVSGGTAEDVSSSLEPAAPLIGHRLLTRAQRKDIKKVHVPQGIVMRYEGELVTFLDQLTLSDDNTEEESGEEGSDGESTHSEPSEWVFVQPPTMHDSEAMSLPDVQTEAEKAENTRKLSTSHAAPTAAAIAAIEKKAEAESDEDERPKIYLRWDIQDQFLRFVAHALCSFYGLVSFSKTAVDGKRLVYICHPAHLDSIGELTVAIPSPSPAVAATISAPSETAKPSRPKPPKRQTTLEHVQELSLHELDQLWKKVEPVKVANCLRPDMTFFEYLYPSTRVMF